MITKSCHIKSNSKFVSSLLSVNMRFGENIPRSVVNEQDILILMIKMILFGQEPSAFNCKTVFLILPVRNPI
jgi:hypothetical protein